MPWSEVLLPPLAGVVRGVSTTDYVVWTDRGLFRYEIETYPAVRMLHPPGKAQEKFDPATGQIRWLSNTYHLVGDPDHVPTTPVSPVLLQEHSDRTLRLAARRVEAVDEAGRVELAVDGFPPPSGGWSVAMLQGWELLLAHDGGVRLFRYSEPEPTPQQRWDRAGVGRDHASLLAAVLAEPDEDAPRLVYADWLEENGDPARAEFIRVQCRLAQRERDGPIPDDDTDYLRSMVLQGEHRLAWRGELPRVRGVRYGCTRCNHHRGFVTLSVHTPVALVRAASQLLAVNPIEYVQIWDLNPENVGPLVRSPVLARLRVLESGWDRHSLNRALGPLFASPHVKGLRILRAPVNDQGARAIARSEHLTGLEVIDDASNEITDAGAEALLASAHLKALRWINLRGCDVSTGLVRRLRKRFALVLR
jgi:uncharacterized protein (TIGR02996 family)